MLVEARRPIVRRFDELVPVDVCVGTVRAACMMRDTWYMLLEMGGNQQDCHCRGISRPDRARCRPGPRGFYDLQRRQEPGLNLPDQVEWLLFGRWYDGWALLYEDIKVGLRESCFC